MTTKRFNHLINKARPFLPMIVGKARHFTFILNKNKILSFGFAQSFKTAPLAKKYGYRFSNIHSELHAIMRFPLSPNELKNCTMVNIRFMSNGSVGMSKPCVNCQRLIMDFQVGEVWFTNKSGEFELL